MAESLFVRLIEHNNWANQLILDACSALSDEQLDAEPLSATKGSIRRTLLHFVASQQGYLSLLTLPLEERRNKPVAVDDLAASARRSGEGLLALLRDGSGEQLNRRLQTADGYYVESWVVLLQVINHATEHREQIKSMLSALGVTPPDIDGWDYGLATNTLVPISD